MSEKEVLAPESEADNTDPVVAADGKDKSFKQYIKKLKGGLDGFMESDRYIFLVACIVLLFSSLGQDLVGFLLVVILLSYSLIFKLDKKATLPPLFLCFYCLSTQHSLLSDNNKPTDYFLKTGNIVFIAIIAAIFLAGIVVGFIRGKITIKLTPHFFGFALLSLSYLMGGFFFKGYNGMSFLVGLVFSVLFFGGYLYFVSFVKKADFCYIAKLMIAVSTVAALELLVFYLLTPAMRESFDKALLNMGWGVSNSVGIMIAMGMPFVCCFMSQSQKPVLWFLYLCGLAAALVLTFARAALIIAVPVCVVGSVYALLKQTGKPRFSLGVAGAVVVIAAIVFAVMFWSKLTEMLNFYIKTGIDLRGRDRLIFKAFEAFKAAPIFGTGWMYNFASSESLPFLMLYHNNFAQVIANGGIFGLITYLIHIALIVLVILKRPKEQRSFLGVGILMIVVHSMFDCVYYFPYLSFMYVIFIALAENMYKEETGTEFSTGFLKTAGKLFAKIKRKKTSDAAGKDTADAEDTASGKDTADGADTPSDEN